MVGCEKTYVALFAEAEGFSHVHFHVVPRMADLDPSLHGPRVFQLLGVGADETMDGAAVDVAVRPTGRRSRGLTPSPR